MSGNEDIFEQKFSVNGARRYKIEGAESAQIIEFKAYFTTSSAEDCGYFRCSDERLNKIYRLILKAIESNINHSHTDCPTIEKLGWLETTHLMARSVMYNKDVDMLWSKIAMDMRDAQYTADESDIDNGAFPHEYKNGLIPSIAPRFAKFTTDWKEGSFWDIIPWGSSIILAAYEQYRFYGNRKVLEDNYESAKRYMDYLTKQYNDYNRLYHKNGEERFICAGLGDWGITQGRGRSRENIEAAFYYHDRMTMAEISQILGKGDENGELTQANQAIPLCFGLVPDEHISEVQNTLIKLCESSHLQCGEERKIKIAYIGGGSKQWARTFMSDLAVAENLSGEIALYDIDMKAAELNARIGGYINQDPRTKSKFEYKLYERLHQSSVRRFPGNKGFRMLSRSVPHAGISDLCAQGD